MSNRTTSSFLYSLPLAAALAFIPSSVATAQHATPPAHPHTATPVATPASTSAATTQTMTPASIPVTPEDALLRLIEGNERFVNGKMRVVDYKQERAKLLTSQHPYAVVLACSDSRVPTEILFDEALGRLFVIRVAGNVIDEVVLGSIEYAAKHLNTKLLLVLGHESCGAVKAAVAGGHLTPNIDKLIEHIAVPVRTVRARHKDEKTVLDDAIIENVQFQMMDALKSSSVLAEMVAHKQLRIVGGVYDLHTGKINFMSEAVPTTKPAVHAASTSK